MSAPDKAKLLELAALAEAASGPDRELDLDIATAVRRTPFLPRWSGQTRALQAKAYTASLDAAMTLVPEGAWDHMEVYKPDHQSLGWTVHLLPNANLPRHHGTGFAASWALAICASALRAHAALVVSQ